MKYRLMMVLGAMLAGGLPSHAQQLRLAAINEPGETLPLGDKMLVTRAFGPWTLTCELSVSKNKRLCSIEQQLQDGKAAVYWRVAQSLDNRPALVFSVPGNLDTKSGLILDFEGFKAAVSGQDWHCNPTCVAVVPLAGSITGRMVNAESVGLSYQTRSGDRLTLVASMAGFEQALLAAGKDPFGKRVPAQTAKRIPVPANKPEGQAQTAKVMSYNGDNQ